MTFENKRYALIVAGGSGTRMNSAIAKQFLVLEGKPVLMHTLQRFFDFDQEMEIILVLPHSNFDHWLSLCRDYSFSIPFHLIAGGKERFESVKNGLDYIEGEGLVAIHDGVRPLVSSETIDRCMKTAQEKGNAIPVLKVTESMRQTNHKDNFPVDRNLFITVQTPQVFQISEIKRAYSMGYDPKFTDDATVLERMGVKINLVEGNRENLKITLPADLILAEALLKSRY